MHSHSALGRVQRPTSAWQAQSYWGPGAALYVPVFAQVHCSAVRGFVLTARMLRGS